MFFRPQILGILGLVPRPDILDLGTRLRFALMFNDTVPCSWSGKLPIVPTCQ